MTTPTFLSESRVQQLLDWDKIYESIKCAMESVSKHGAFQNRRYNLQIGNTNNYLFSMCGYLDDAKYGGLGCKLFTSIPENSRKNLPTTIANIFLLDENSGNVKAVVAGTQITEWRTAAASAVATKQLHGVNNNILAVLGTGAQGRAHVLAFEHLFNFSEIRIWNRSMERTRNVVDELNTKRTKNTSIVAFDNIQNCVNNADVIITATSGNETLLQQNWLKDGIHINAIRVNPFHRELEDAIYKSADVYVDYWEGAENELQGIKRLGVQFKGQIGDVISGQIRSSGAKRTTVFQSLGMPVEDIAAARMVYDLDASTRS